MRVLPALALCAFAALAFVPAAEGVGAGLVAVGKTLSPEPCDTQLVVLAGARDAGGWTFAVHPTDWSPYACAVDRPSAFQGSWDPATGHALDEECLPEIAIQSRKLCLGPLASEASGQALSLAICPRDRPLTHCTRGTALTVGA